MQDNGRKAVVTVPTAEGRIPKERIGRYKLIYPIGRGGMAEIFMAQISGMAGFEKLVALKVILPHLASDSSFVDMFLDEARITAKVIHPNVASVLEVGEENGLFYQALELVQGQSVDSLMQHFTDKGESIDQSIVAHIGSSVCAGLHSAHELEDQSGVPFNLIHRDVSPQNILIAYGGFVKLIDFGVAKAQGRLAETKVGQIKGKMAYMAPEQVVGGPIDRRVDVFALGVVLYRMVTGGRHPFPGETLWERLRKLKSNTLIPPCLIDPSLSPKMEQIILTAMHHDPDDRYPSAAIMGSALNAFVRSEENPAGQRELSALMRDVFSEEIAKEKVRIKTHIQKKSKPRTANVPAPRPIMPMRPTLPPSRPTRPSPSEYVVEELEDFDSDEDDDALTVVLLKPDPKRLEELSSAADIWEEVVGTDINFSEEESGVHVSLSEVNENLPEKVPEKQEVESVRRSTILLFCLFFLCLAGWSVYTFYLKPGSGKVPPQKVVAQAQMAAPVVPIVSAPIDGNDSGADVEDTDVEDTGEVETVASVKPHPGVEKSVSQPIEDAGAGASAPQPKEDSGASASASVPQPKEDAGASVNPSHPEAPVGKIKVRIWTRPKWATVLWGGERVKKRLFKVPRSQEPVIVTFSAKGYNQKEVSVVPKKSMTIRVRLSRVKRKWKKRRKAKPKKLGNNPYPSE